MESPPSRLASDIALWLVDKALATPIASDLFARVAERLRAGGVQVDRVHAAYTTLNPLHSGEGITWSVDGGLEVEAYEHDRDPDLNQWRRSPILHAIRNETPLMRRRLTGPDAVFDFDVLGEFASRGYTDYVLNVRRFAAFHIPPEKSGRDDGPQSSGVAISYATKRAGGFTEAEVQTLTWLCKPLALATKVAVQHGIATELARCYIGHAAGPRVLAGAIRRGDFDSTRAVVWFSDLRDSTELASTLTRADYITMLNRFFDCTAGAVQSEGGEPLTFIGDGVLAIFPVDEMGAAEARNAAIRAANLATTSLRAYNREREAESARPLGFGVALHAGDMAYGNIGVPARQSWSVIGPVVNETARLEGMTKLLGEPIVASAEFATALDPAWRALGAHALKGVARPFEVFAPPRTS
jgi:adenylate cyclase